MGDAFYYYITPGQNPGTAGASQTWNFSGITYSNSYRGDYAICTASPHCSAFPGSTIALMTPNVSYFMAVDGDSFFSTGVWYDRSVDVEEKYPDPQTLLRFPLTYGDSYVDSFRAVQILGNDTLTRRGSDSTLADGWGTLLIKSANLSNVLRVKKILTIEERIDTGGTPIIFHARSVSYYWYLPGYREYLLYTTTMSTDNPFVAPQHSEGRYTGMVNGGNAGVGASASSLFSLENPARGILHVSLGVGTTEPLDWRITDLLGRSLAKSNKPLATGKTSLHIPLETLAPGIYLINIRQGSRQDTQRFVVE